jgi:hypothetical protein
LVLTLGIVLSAGVASADEPPAGDPGVAQPAEVSATHAQENYAKSDWPPAFVLRSVTVPAGVIWIAVPLAINLSTDQVGKPVALPLQVFYGITNDIQVGVTHQTGLCFTGTDNGCPKFYNDISFDFLYRFLRGDFDLAAHAALPISAFSPEFLLGVQLGASGRATLANGKLALLFDPSITIAITKRSVDDGEGGTIRINHDFLHIPVSLAFQATPKLAVGLETSISGPLDAFGDTLRGELGIFGLYNINKNVDAFLQFAFTNLYGKHPGGESAADGRILIIGANIFL